MLSTSFSVYMTHVSVQNVPIIGYCNLNHQDHKTLGYNRHVFLLKCLQLVHDCWIYNGLNSCCMCSVRLCVDDENTLLPVQVSILPLTSMLANLQFYISYLCIFIYVC